MGGGGGGGFISINRDTSICVRSEDLDQTVLMRRLIQVVTVGTCIRVHFLDMLIGISPTSLRLLRGKSGGALFVLIISNNSPPPFLIVTPPSVRGSLVRTNTLKRNKKAT